MPPKGPQFPGLALPKYAGKPSSNTKGTEALQQSNIDLDGMTLSEPSGHPSAISPAKRKHGAAPLSDNTTAGASKGEKPQSQALIDLTQAKSSDQSDSSSTNPTKRRRAPVSASDSAKPSGKGKQPQGPGAVSGEDGQDLEAVLSAQRKQLTLKHEFEKIQTECQSLTEQLDALKKKQSSHRQASTDPLLKDTKSQMRSAKKEYDVAKREAKEMFAEWQLQQGLAARTETDLELSRAKRNALQKGIRRHEELAMDDSRSTLIASGHISAKDFYELLNTEKKRSDLGSDHNTWLTERQRLADQTNGPDPIKADVKERYVDAVKRETESEIVFKEQTSRARELLKLFQDQQTAAIQAENNPKIKEAKQNAFKEALRLHKRVDEKSSYLEIPDTEAADEPASFNEVLDAEKKQWEFKDAYEAAQTERESIEDRMQLGLGMQRNDPAHHLEDARQRERESKKLFEEQKDLAIDMQTTWLAAMMAEISAATDPQAKAAKLEAYYKGVSLLSAARGDH